MLITKALELFAQGQEAWNAWALDLLEQRRLLQEAGEWNEAIVRGTSRDHGSKTNSWLMRAYLDFSNYTFADDTSFEGFVFPGPVKFTKMIFEKQMNFNDAAFHGAVYFDQSEFKDRVWFEGATFHDQTDFKETKFHRDVSFKKSIFLDGASFSRSVFHGNSSEFYEAVFHKSLAFDNVEFNGGRFARTTFHSSAMFHETVFHMNGTFNGCTFFGDAIFANALFHRVAWFDEVKFNKEARFHKANFHGEANFGKTVFHEEAKFGEVVFHKSSAFNKADFHGEADFSNVTFQGGASFTQARFSGHTVFSPTIFKQDAAFNAMDVRSSFRLEQAEFAFVPDFVQAHFAEAPTLDAMRTLKSKAPVANETARWRALKRIAIQAHDHDREQAYFASELRARRGAEDRFWHMRFWFGWLYELLSNFGNSVWRPAFWWLVSTTLFALTYLATHFAVRATDQASAAYDMWPAAWLGRWFTGIFHGPLAPPPLSCVAGTGEPVYAALLLSVRKGLLFAGLDASSKADQTYACLYGLDERLRTELGGRGVDLIPLIPDSIIFLGLVQTLISATLLFLFLLALRNAFKIR